MYCLLRIFTGVSLSCITSFCFAATEFDRDIPRELLRYFSGGGTIYSDLLDNFPPFIMPDGLRLMGSQDSMGNQKVLIRTSRGGGESQAALVDEFLSQGWQILPGVNASRDWGFIIVAKPGQIVPITICHNDYGNLEIRARDFDGPANRVYVRRYNYIQVNESNDCELQRERRLYTGIGPPPGLRPPVLFMYLPQLVLPEEFNIPPISRFVDAVFFGGSNSIMRDLTLNSDDWTAEEFYNHFASQLTAQSWAQQSASFNSLEATGDWALEAENDLSLVGIFKVEEVEEGEFYLVFSMEKE